MIKLSNKDNINLINLVSKSKKGIKSFLEMLVDSVLLAILITILFASIKSCIGITMIELISTSKMVFLLSSIFNLLCISGISMKRIIEENKSIKKINKFIENLGKQKQLVDEKEIINGDVFELYESGEYSFKEQKNRKRVDKMIVMDEKQYWCAIKQITETFIKNNNKHEINSLYLLNQDECLEEFVKLDEKRKKLCKVVDLRATK